jgi:hypothetical protein
MFCVVSAVRRVLGTSNYNQLTLELAVAPLKDVIYCFSLITEGIIGEDETVV